MRDGTPDDDVPVFLADTIQPANPGCIQHRFHHRASTLLDIQQKIGTAAKHTGASIVVLQ
jgi:hypothetical protein